MGSYPTDRVGLRVLHRVNAPGTGQGVRMNVF